MHLLPRALVGATVGVGGVALIGKMVGLARDIVMANRFGTGEVVAGFFAYVAWQALVVVAVVDAVTVEQTRASAANDMSRVRNLWWITIVLGAALGTIQAILAGPLSAILTQGTEQRSEVAAALVWTAPGSAAMCLLGACAGVLNGRSKFVWAASLTVCWSGLALVGLAVAPSARLAVYGAWSAAMCVVAIIGLLYLYPRQVGGRPAQAGRTSWGTGSLLLISAATVMYHLSFPIERYAASGLSPDAVASVGYAYKLIAFPVGLTLSGLVAWAIPGFVAAMAVSEAEFRRLAGRICCLAVVPAVLGACLVLLLSDEIVTVTFARGAFDGAAVSLTTDALRGYAFGLPALVLYVVGVKACQAKGHLISVVVGSGLGALTALLTISGLASGLGVFGVTLATSLGSTVAASVVVTCAFSSTRRPDPLPSAAHASMAPDTDDGMKAREP